MASGLTKPNTVMVVDDDANFCDSLEDILSLEGYAAFSANSCHAALQTARLHNPQVVLLDYKLPDGYGSDLISQLRRQNPDCACIIVTAYADLDAAVTALDQGAYHFLKKPFQPAELLGLLKRAFETVSLREGKRIAEEELKARNKELENMVTEQKHLEAQLIQTQKLEAIGTLASGVAHDFNNVLAGIIGYTELALLNTGQLPEVQNFLYKSLDACNRAKKLIEQILAFSHQGEKELNPVIISPILKEALKFLRSTLPSTITIEGHIEPDTGTVMADATQIHRVIMNLCTNAAHAMQRDGGRLTVSLKTISGESWQETNSRLHNLPPEPCLSLSVQDTGTGIAPSIRERIFDPYFTTKEKGEGTGLGLAVVQGIVENYNGAIEMSSEVDYGTAFHIYLPLKEIVKEKRVETQEQPLRKGTERLLLVDDEPNLVEIGAQMLRYLGYVVTTATDSLAALEMFQADPSQFDLVITDMTMPHLTGDILARALMEIRPNLPIILSTGYNENITAEKAQKIGIRGFVMKPIDLRTLAKTVRDALDNARPD